MSGNIKLRWFLLVPLLLVILSVFGCASAKNVSYTPGGMIDPWFRESGPKIFVKEFGDKSGDAGKFGGPYPFCGGAGSYVSDLNCPQLFKDAFTKEFQTLGLQVVENMNAAQIIMNGTILRFDDDKPLMGLIWAGTVQVNLEFFDQSRNLLLQVNLSATDTEPNILNIGGRRLKHINKLIPKLLSQVHAYPNAPTSFSNRFTKVLEQVSGKQTATAVSSSSDLQITEKQQMVSSAPLSLSDRELNNAQKQVRLYPDNAGTHLTLGELYQKRDRLDEAIGSFKEAARITPNNADMHIILAHAYRQVDQYRDAIASIKEAIRLRPDDADGYNTLGMFYEKLSKYQDAIDSYKEAIRLKPGHARAHKNIGFAYEFMGRNDKAIEAYRKSFRINPNDTFVRDSLNQLERKMARASPGLQPLEQQPVPGGTGFLFSSKDYILTNYHVVKGKHSIKAKFTNGDVIEADIVSKDAKNDIAILKLKRPSSIESRELQFGDSSKVRMGEKVFTIGFPASFVLGERPKYTEGVISAVTGIKDDPTVFQITVPIQPGNSGGPLFNQRGEVIGITTASLSLRATEVLGAVPQNINYALKSSFVKNLLTSIPESLLSNRGIVVVPKGPENSLADFIEAVTGNVVLIEAKE